MPPDSCSPYGLLLMEVEGENAEIKQFLTELNGLREVSAKHIVI
jgi:hypothetical protein